MPAIKTAALITIASLSCLGLILTSDTLNTEPITEFIRDHLDQDTPVQNKLLQLFNALTDTPSAPLVSLIPWFFWIPLYYLAKLPQRLDLQRKIFFGSVLVATLDCLIQQPWEQILRAWLFVYLPLAFLFTVLLTLAVGMPDAAEASLERGDGMGEKVGGLEVSGEKL